MSHPCCAWRIGKTEELNVQGFSLQLKKAPESNSSELHFQKEAVQKQNTTLFWFFTFMSDQNMLVYASGVVKYKL